MKSSAAEGGEALYARPISTVGALIFNREGQVLMVRTQKWSNLWGIPGGKIKFGESSIQALKRELKEETNLSVTDIRFVLVQDCIHSKEFQRDAHFILLNYTCRAQGRTVVKLNDEAQAFTWATIDEALAMELNQPTRVLLEQVKKESAQRSPDTITIRDLEVFYHVGVPDKEREQPQRLLLTVQLESDFSAAARLDDLTKTIDYFAVTQRLRDFGRGRSWKLIETLAVDIADVVLREFGGTRVRVEVKKFIISETEFVGVAISRP